MFAELEDFVENPEDPNYDQGLEEDFEESKFYLFDHIEPVFCNSLIDQLKTWLIIAYAMYCAI